MAIKMALEVKLMEENRMDNDKLIKLRLAKHGYDLLMAVDKPRLLKMAEELESLFAILNEESLTPKSRIGTARVILRNLKLGDKRVIRETGCPDCDEDSTSLPHCEICGLHHARSITCDENAEYLAADSKMGDSSP